MATYPAPYFYRPAVVGEGMVHIIGPNGDSDPQQILTDLLVLAGAKDVYLATSIAGAISGTGRWLATSTLPIWVEGDVDALVIYNPQGSGGTSQMQLSGSKSARRNSGQAAGSQGRGSFDVRLPVAANAVTDVSVRAPRRGTVSAIKTWSKTVPEEDPPTGTVACVSVTGGATFTFAGVVFTEAGGGAVAANQQFDATGNDIADAASLVATFNDAASQALITAALGGGRTVTAANGGTNVVTLTAGGTDDEYVTNGTMASSNGTQLALSGAVLTDPGSYLLDVINARTGRSLLAAPVDLNDLTTVTLQSQTLSTTPAFLDFEDGDILTVRGTSTQGALTAGDVAVSIEWTPR